MPSGPGQLEINPDGSIAACKLSIVSNPVAGADFSFSVSNTGLLIAVAATLTTAVAAANRLPTLLIAAAGVTAFRPTAANVQTASLTENYTWGVSCPFASGNNQNFIPLPAGLVLTSGWTITSSTAAIQAADQWSNIVLTFAGP